MTTQKPSEPEMRPCPFCGSGKLNVCETHYEPEKRSAFVVTCTTKQCHGVMFQGGYGQFKTRELAIKAWNCRVAAPQPAQQTDCLCSQEGNICVEHEAQQTDRNAVLGQCAEYAFHSRINPNSSLGIEMGEKVFGYNQACSEISTKLTALKSTPSPPAPTVEAVIDGIRVGSCPGVSGFKIASDGKVLFTGWCFNCQGATKSQDDMALAAAKFILGEIMRQIGRSPAPIDDSYAMEGNKEYHRAHDAFMQQPEWQPIETAPKDRRIDLFMVASTGKPIGRYVDCWWSKSRQRWSHDPEDKMNEWPVEMMGYKATHWMSVPTPPQQPEDK